MANALYPLFKQALLTGGAPNFSTGTTIKAQLVTAAYAYSATDQFMTAFSGKTVGTAVALSTLSAALGVFSAANVTFSAVAAGTAAAALILYNDTGTPGTSILIAYIDTATGLPVTPNGGDITIAWDTGASKIFAL